MPVTYSKFYWGWEVFDSGTSQNNKLDFDVGATPFTATLKAGIYTAREFAAEVQSAMRAAASSSTITCVFSESDGKFTISDTGSLTLKFNTGTNVAIDCNGLLGFVSTADTDTSPPHLSDASAGTAPSTAFSWTMAEPNSKHTPVIAAAAGTAAANLQRAVRAVQNVSDGGKVETIHISTMKRVSIGFRALSATEQTKMETLLDWITQGKRFSWQPDSASPNALYLVIASPGEINNDFTWLTRSETDYGDLTFYEQLT